MQSILVRWLVSWAVVAPAVLAVAAGAAANEPIKPIPAETGVNPDVAALGRLLFHAPRLSRDQSISCASCHDLATGGDDGRRVSEGIEGRPVAGRGRHPVPG